VTIKISLPPAEPRKPFGQPSHPSAVQETIRFTSVLETHYRDDLEGLMFFNPQQKKTLAGINRSIKDFGVPSVTVDAERLRITVEGLSDAQALYALKEKDGSVELIGVIVFVRLDPENLVLLHIAVREDYSRGGEHGEEMLVGRLVGELRAIARRIRGVRHVILKYSGGLMIPVDPAV
jgi:hypothetical protein